MIATNESREDGGRYVEVIDLINPELVRKFIDTRVALIDLIGGGGLLGDQPGEQIDWNYVFFFKYSSEKLIYIFFHNIIRHIFPFSHLWREQ